MAVQTIRTELHDLIDLLSEEDAAAEEAWQEYLRGESVSSAEAKRLFLP